MIITPDADIKLAVNAAVFSALGTTGQRCTTLRRLIVHKKIYANVKNELLKIYENLTPSIGHPLHSDKLVGPLIDKDAVKIFMNVQKQIIKEGGKIIFGGQILNGTEFESGCFVVPAIAEVGQQVKIIKQETFVPLMFLMSYTDFEEALALQNDVPHGLSSSVFSKNIQETERFISVNGSDCGIANVNIGTSGAEIGLAFGGEKDSGGGREAGSDVWKHYMRRQSCTINFGSIMPLAQGVKFNLKKRK